MFAFAGAFGSSAAPRLYAALAPFTVPAVVVAIPRNTPERARFRRRGDEWELELQGRRVVVAHRVGMTYLRCLLERPGTAVAAIELASLGTDALLVEHRGGRALDGTAIREVRRRIDEIDREIAAVERRGAVPSADLRRERSECVAYMDRRATALVSSADRARSGVTKAIVRAIAAIRRVHEGFAHHLDRHVETGRLCTYVPDPAGRLRFEL